MPPEANRVGRGAARDQGTAAPGAAQAYATSRDGRTPGGCLPNGRLISRGFTVG